MATASVAFRSTEDKIEFPPKVRQPKPLMRVLTVDAHPLVQEGLAAIINSEADMTVVAQACSGREAMDRFKACQPDLVTLDLWLSDMPGEAVARRIFEETPRARIVVVTSTQGDVRIQRCLQMGVQGYVLKGMPTKELLDVLRQVNAGRKAIPRQVASRIAEHLADEKLTPREIQVLSLVAQGNRNKEVAGHLNIADETVRMHMKNILGKLAANDRTHAVTIAMARGFIELSASVAS